jgi:hypothetical protein
MVTSQWLLKRVAESERQVRAYIAFGEQQFKMLAYLAKQRAQLERSFRTAIDDMNQSQKQRQARQPRPPQTAQPAKPAAAPPRDPAAPLVAPPDYVMSEGAQAHPAFCPPALALRIAVSESAPQVFDNQANDATWYATTLYPRPGNTICTVRKHNPSP